MDKRELAKKYRSQGCNCAQAVLCSFAKECNISEDVAYRLTEGLGSGIGKLESFCGATNGLAIAMGLLNSQGIDSKGASKADTANKIKALVENFEVKNGSYICKDLKASNSEFRSCEDLIDDCVVYLQQYIDK